MRRLGFLLAPLIALGASTPAAIPQSEENPPDPKLGRGPRVYHPTRPAPVAAVPTAGDAVSQERIRKAEAKRLRKAALQRARFGGKP